MSQRWKSIAISIAAISFTLLGGCENGDDSPDNTIPNVAGTWQAHLVQPGADGWTDDIVFQIAQSGGTVTLTMAGYPSIAGTLDGRHLVMTIPGTEGEEAQIMDITFSADGNSFSGVLYEIEGDVEYTTVTGNRVP